jgi:Protein of unknown function (DUF998)
MIQHTDLVHSDSGVTRIAARIALMFAAIFLAILLLLHFLEPEFDPSWRMISEYEIGHYGWMMSLAFFCWGGSVLALFVAIGRSLRTIAGLIGRGWLLVIGFALFGAGIFITNPITDTTPSTANSLHTLCGAIVILTFPFAASLIAGSLSRSQESAIARHRLIWGTILVWLGLFAFFASIIISRIINPTAGRVGPAVFLGWPNRFLVVADIIWLVIFALNTLPIPRQNNVKTQT